MRKKILISSIIIAAILLIAPFLISNATIEGSVTQEGFLYNGKSLMIIEQSVNSEDGANIYNGIIFGFKFSRNGDTAATFREKFSTSKYKEKNNSENVTFKLYDINGNELNDNANVGTCTKLVIEDYTGEILNNRYNLDILCYGDTTGDGVIDAGDALAVIKNKLEIIPFNNEILEEAGRIDTIEETPNANDALMIIKHRLGDYTIDQTRGISPIYFRNQEIEQEIADRLASDNANDYIINVSYNPAGTYEWNKELATSNETGTETLNSATGEAFNVSEWRVLDVDPETGDVTLVPKSIAEGTVTLQGAMGYNNAVKLLNDTCNSLYGDSSVGAIARSISEEDFVKLGGDAWSEYKSQNSGNQISKKLTGSKSEYPGIYELENNSVIDEETKTGLGQSEQYNYISKTEDGMTDGYKLPTSIQPYNTAYRATEYDSETLEYNTELTSQLLGEKNAKILLPNGSESHYWISSRCINGVMDNMVFYSVHDVNNGGFEFANLCASLKSFNSLVEDPAPNSLLPVVTISSGYFKSNSIGTGYIISDENSDPTNVRDTEIEQEISDRLDSDDADDYLINVSYNPAGTYEWSKELATSIKTETGTETLSSATGEDFNISQWRVLDVDTATGKVRLVPKTIATGTVTLQGPMGYNNAVKLLNDACKYLYSDSSSGATARSINIEDIESIMSKNIELPIAATNPVQTDIAFSSGNSNYPVMYKNENLSVINECDPKTDGLGLSQQTSFIQRSEGTTSFDRIGAITMDVESIRPFTTLYGKDNSSFTTALGNKSEIILPNGSSTSYWIASRCVGIRYGITNPIDSAFYVRYANSGALAANNMFESNSLVAIVKDPYPLFPVVTISSGQLKQTSDGKGYYIGDTEPVTPDEPSEPTITPANYGDTVNYSTSLNGVELDDWKLFYSEDDYVWLIYGDYLPNAAVPSSIGLGTYGDYAVNLDTSREDLITKLTTTSNWSDLINNGSMNGTTLSAAVKGDSNVKAMGSPDLELYKNSWNAKYPDNTTYTTNQLYIAQMTTAESDGLFGYYVSRAEPATTEFVTMLGTEGYKSAAEADTLYYPHAGSSTWNSTAGYWLASPSVGYGGLMNVDCTGFINIYGYNLAAIFACRPVICLPACVLNQ